MEPFKIKSVEHIRITKREERIDALKKEHIYTISSFICDRHNYIGL